MGHFAGEGALLLLVQHPDMDKLKRMGCLDIRPIKVFKIRYLKRAHTSGLAEEEIEKPKCL